MAVEDPEVGTTYRVILGRTSGVEIAILSVLMVCTLVIVAACTVRPTEEWWALVQKSAELPQIEEKDTREPKRRRKKRE